MYILNPKVHKENDVTKACETFLGSEFHLSHIRETHLVLPRNEFLKCLLPEKDQTISYDKNSHPKFIAGKYCSA